ncbi:MULTISPECIES: nucleoside diphosphate kinase regulator [Motilimonas]|uniref:Nucleoside diphosphate kinase regulator n=1 Tax=Motilimonas cestriensis TaxID=2742685 RepID=A0ABS8W7G2_9GAMM|nr:MULTISPECIES: nucleoside diphosphate kinase regulator [Motilimonas]MCE0555930.1 nucleoside diphosphate kinase regulator [Motilimonas sp. E26]MCE2593691.1 nucleoside diphosphate kinase regulator [Motilimonas cestriensis]MDO6528162.1 nucleoside diphosphate kinase regulator [Motilimonas sp. 1_MG-2023]
MTQSPSITISSLDADRLEKLLDSLGDKEFPGKDGLQAELDRANIVEPEQMPPNTVTMNSTVRFKVANSDKELAYTLSYPSAINNTAGDNSEKISILAPIGTALLGLSEGDQIEWPKPGGGLVKVEIIEVLYQPEREGELHR